MKKNKLFLMAAMSAIAVLFSATIGHAAAKDPRSAASVWVGKEKKEAVTIQSMRESSTPTEPKVRKNSASHTKDAAPKPESKKNNAFTQKPKPQASNTKPSPSPIVPKKVAATSKTKPTTTKVKDVVKPTKPEDNLFELKSKKDGNSVFQLFGDD